MFFPVVLRKEPDPSLPVEARPPEVVVDSSGAEVRFWGVSHWRIEWTQIREVAVEVIVYDGGGAEGFWNLSGESVELCAPVEIVAGSEAFNARLFALPGFDTEAYQRSRAAEAAATSGLFVCWRASLA